MKWSSLLCLGSTLSALVGLLLLSWGARRERGRVLWVLVAAVFLIGAGFGTAETLRRAFHRRLGVSPNDYRQRFRMPELDSQFDPDNQEVPS